MPAELIMIIALLKATRNGQALIETIKKEARLPSTVASKLLQKLQSDGLVYSSGNAVSMDTIQRLELAIKAVILGSDVQQVSSFLHWHEFESMASSALKLNGYTVTKNLRFKHGGRRWEMDLVACRKPLVLCVDCKHWHRTIHPSSVREIVAKQAERTKAFADLLPAPCIKTDCVKWGQARFIPAVLSLMPNSMRTCDGVPIVAVTQVQDFLDKLPLHTDELKTISKSWDQSLNRSL